MNHVVVGIIGGTGLGEALGTLGQGEVREVETPFGRPSGPITLTEVAGVPVALLSRHGPGHLLNPPQVPYRANIYALKTLGVTHVIASGAVGSLREEIAPKRPGHPRPGDRQDLPPPRHVLRRPGRARRVRRARSAAAAQRCWPRRSAGFPSPVRIHQGGTYVCMEGPQFSTRAESELHRRWGGDLIGMTVMPEAKLAREAEICYALVALPTDYDCWRPHPAKLDQAKLLEEIIGNLKVATQNAIELIRRSMPARGGAGREALPCQSALALAIWSDKSKLTPETRQRLKPLLGKYLGSRPRAATAGGPARAQPDGAASAFQASSRTLRGQSMAASSSAVTHRTASNSSQAWTARVATSATKAKFMWSPFEPARCSS